MTVDDLARIEKKIDQALEKMEACVACQLQVAINTRRLSNEGDIGKGVERLSRLGDIGEKLMHHDEELKGLNAKWWAIAGGLAVITFLLPVSVGVYAVVNRVK